jgi:ABC-2 type transport system permease protein
MNHTWANIRTITKRELSSYFTSPVAYVFIVIFLLLVGFFTFDLGFFYERNEASLQSSFGWHPWLYLFLVPAVGMRLWAEEKRVGTIELLMTMPITPWQAIVGKFLASWLFLAIALVLTFPLVLTVNYLGDPDNGVIFASYVGSWLMAGAYLAVTCATSALTRNQVIAFILSVVICFLLVLAGYPPMVRALSGFNLPWLVNLVTGFSVMTHFESVQKGIFDLRDFVFFLSVIGVALFTTSVLLRSQRAG